MDAKRLINAFYRILQKLPDSGKILALVSMTTLYCAYNPPVDKPNWNDMHYAYFFLEERNGKVVYGWHGSEKVLDEHVTYVPTHYINTRAKPKAGDAVTVYYFLSGDKNLYLKNNYVQNKASLYSLITDDKKNEKRKRMLVSFIFSSSLCLFSYPGLITGLIKLIKRI